MRAVYDLGLMLLIIVVWSILAPLTIRALRRWAYSLNRPWLGSAIGFVVTLALSSLVVAVWLWWARMAMPAAINARASMLGVAIGEGAAMLMSAIIAGAFFRSLNRSHREAIPINPSEPR